MRRKREDADDEAPQATAPGLMIFLASETPYFMTSWWPGVELQKQQLV